MIEVFYLHNKQIPEKEFLSITSQWKFKIGSDDKKIVMIENDDDYRNMANVVRAILDLNEAGYIYPEDFEWTAG